MRSPNLVPSKRLAALPPLALTLAALGLGAGPASCDLASPASGQVIKALTLPVPAQQVPSGGPLGSLLNLAGYDFNLSQAAAGSAASVAGTESITVEAIGLRTLLDTPEDRAKEALTDASLIEPCRPGQKPITFLHSLKIFIQKKGEPATARLLAQYTMPMEKRDRPGVCGFFLETDDTLNLKDFLPEYETRVEATGRAPSQNTSLGGLVEVLYLGRASLTE